MRSIKGNQPNEYTFIICRHFIQWIKGHCNLGSFANLSLLVSFFFCVRCKFLSFCFSKLLYFLSFFFFYLLEWTSLRVAKGEVRQKCTSVGRGNAMCNKSVPTHCPPPPPSSASASFRPPAPLTSSSWALRSFVVSPTRSATRLLWHCLLVGALKCVYA